MKKFKGVFALGLLTLCLAATQLAHAAEDRNTKIKAEMVQNYLLWEVALKNKDAERIISFESPDFTSVMVSGYVNKKKESDENLRDVMKNIQKVHAARANIKKLTIEPNRVVILSNKMYDIDIKVNTENLSARVHRIFVTAVQRDIWVQYDGVWMLKRTESVSSSGTIDGKPAPD